MPAQAAPKSPPTCNLTGVPRPSETDGSHTIDPATDSKGTVKWTTITLPAGMTLDVTGDLMIIGLTSVEIHGTIQLPFANPGETCPNLTIVCFQGPVVMTGSIAGGRGAPGGDDDGQGPSASASSEAGGNGGWVRIYGELVVVEGFIEGSGGGPAGVATATSTQWGDGRAEGGQGGFGGDVLLCAYERIVVAPSTRPWRVRAGRGGDGGRAVATAPADAVARGHGGNGNLGGDLVFTGTGATPLTVELNGPVRGGAGGSGGRAIGRGADGTGRFRAGDGEADAGHGGDGGGVRFVNANPAPGGPAEASGGRGANGFFFGRHGGEATAHGGEGGRSTAPGSEGRGGMADATSGGGGDATLFLGGWSGTASAWGGLDGNGRAPAGPRPASAGPRRPSWRKGAPPAHAWQRGA